MSKIIAAGTVLLVSEDPGVRRVIRLERGGRPLLCTDSLSTCYRYLEHYEAADLVYLDSVLTSSDTLPSVETRLRQLVPNIKIGYLFKNKEELSRLALPPSTLFRLLETMY